MEKKLLGGKNGAGVHIIRMLVLICIMTTIIASSTVSYAVDAGSKIHIYTQNNYNSYSSAGYDTTTYKGSYGSSKGTLKTRGCCTFAYAHAVQWLDGNNKYNTDDTWSGLLYSLLQVSRLPSTNGGSKYPAALSNGLTVYSNGGKTTRTVKFKEMTIPGNPPSVDFVKSLFDQGGVSIVHLNWDQYGDDSDGGGHYLLAVGYTQRDGVYYIQMVDSKRGTTINRVKSYDYSSFKVITEKWDGGQYWIPLSSFSGNKVVYNNRKAKIKFEKAFLPSSIVNQKPTSIELNQSNVSLKLSDTISLSVTAYPTGASNEVTWSSSDTDVAIVSNGIVTPIKAGKTVTITATSTIDTSVKASCQVTTYYQDSDAANTLKFNGIKYPHTYNSNKSITWTGTVESDVALSSVTMNLYSYTSVTKYSQTGSIPAGAKSFSMSSFGDSTFKKLPSGRFAFELIAVDTAGRTISFANDTCQAVASGNQVYWNAPGTFARPVLKASAENNGHRYELYDCTSGDWNYAVSYANEIGGHLATISDASENEFVCSFVEGAGTIWAYLGGYYSNGWHWIDGTPFIFSSWRSDAPADNTLAYDAIADTARASERTWQKALRTSVNSFVVEYDPIMVSSIVLEGNGTMTYGAGTQILKSTVLPADAYNPTIKYTSSNSSYAYVDENTGEVTVVADTDAIVTIYAFAQDGSGVVGAFPIYIQHKPIPVTGVSISAESTLYTDNKTITLVVGQSTALTETITPYNADNQEIIYYSSDEDIAVFEDYSSQVTALSPGICQLVCMNSDETISDYLNLIVIPIENPPMAVAASYRNDKIRPEDGDTVLLDWSISGGSGNYTDVQINWYLWEGFLHKIAKTDHLSGNSGTARFTLPSDTTRLYATITVTDDTETQYTAETLYTTIERDNWSNVPSISVEVASHYVQDGQPVQAAWTINPGTHNITSVSYRWDSAIHNDYNNYDVTTFNKVDANKQLTGTATYSKASGDRMWLRMFVADDQGFTSDEDGLFGVIQVVKTGQIPFDLVLSISPEEPTTGDTAKISWNVRGISEETDISLWWGYLPKNSDNQFGNEENLPASGERTISITGVGEMYAGIDVYDHKQDLSRSTWTGRIQTYDASTGIIILPNGLNIIEDEAFIGLAANTFDIPSSVTEISASAFAPDSILLVENDSYAEAWAITNGYSYKVK